MYAGLVGVGLNTYWPQFSGLYERLCGYRKQIAKQLEQEHVCVVDGGMVDEPEKAITVAAELERNQLMYYWYIFQRMPFLLRFYHWFNG